MNICRPGLPDVYLNGIWDFKSEADENWTSIRVPGAYTGVRKGWGGSRWDCFDYPREWEDRGGVYRRTFTVPDYMNGHNIRFFCGACAHHSIVYLNEKKVGEWHDGYTPMEFPLGPELTQGENLLEIRVSARKNSLFDDYGTYRRGIWQDCCIRAYPELSVENDLFITTSVFSGEIRCDIPVSNLTGTGQGFTAVCVIRDRYGSEAARFSSERLFLEAGSCETFRLVHKWPDPVLWFPHDPFLYELYIQIRAENARIIDNCRQRFGFREITWEGPHLYINGRELFLRGHGGHYMGDLQGSRPYMEAWLGQMKKMGINFMRLHCSPKHRELYDVADEIGIMLESEAVCHFRVPENERVWKGHIERLVKEQRNHPSVIVWSVSNELRWRGGGEKPEMIEWVKQFDTTRPVFASDFSCESRHGDICGHHYDPLSVFDDWKKYGPDKPMIWDELGSVWQHDRPLDNGTSGYEVRVQDYATGLWHDGHDQILHDLCFMQDGRTWNGELHRVNGYCVWDFIYVLFRWQPLNNNRTISLSHHSLEGPGIKHRHVRPFCSPVNIWDPSLPVLEPNPGYYLFSEYLQPVRFFDSGFRRTLFGGREYTIVSRLFYEDTRLCDRLVCRVETPDGKVLTERAEDLSLCPGDIRESLETVFNSPYTESPMKVKVVREFSYRGRPGSRHELDAKVFPQTVQAGTRVFVWDGDQELISSLRSAGVHVCRSKDRCDTVIVRHEESLDRKDIREYMREGGYVICFCGGNPSDPEFPGCASVPLNGPDHRLLAGLGQEDFSFWRTDQPVHILYPPSGRNYRVVLAGDRDGRGAVLYELFSGSGAAAATSLNLLNSSEPAALSLLDNMLKYAGNYKAEHSGKVMMLANESRAEYFNSIGVDAISFDAECISECSALILDAGTQETAEKALLNQESIREYVSTGGTVLACGANSNTIGNLKELCKLPLQLTDPFMGIRTQCVKAAVSWTRSDTPVRLVEYYESVMVPQPFEQNYDPLIAGLANCDLVWEGIDMFEYGIELKGMDPVRATEEYSILISNWNIDWSKPHWGGEYIHAGKDLRRAEWFLNRDPVLLRAASGRGSYIFCQLDFEAGGQKGRRIMQQILTNMQCSLGEPTLFAEDGSVFDDTGRRDQLKRARARSSTLRPVQRQYYGTPEHILRAPPSTVIKKPVLMLAGNGFLNSLFPYIQERLWESHKALNRLCITGANTRDLLETIEKDDGLADIPIFLLDAGIEDLKLGPDQLPAVSLQEFTGNLKKIVTMLKKGGARINWNTIIPLPPAVPDFAAGMEDIYNRAAQEIMDAHDVYTYDLNRLVRESFPAFLEQTSLEFSGEQIEEMAHQTASAVAFFGAQ